MAGENLTGRIEVLISAGGDAGGSGSAEGGQSTPKSGSSSVDPNQKKRDNEQKGQGKLLNSMKATGAKMAGMLGLVGIAIKAIMGSPIFSAVFGAFMDILTAMVSMLLLPLVPVLIPLLKMFADLIPLVASLAECILGPTMDFLGAILALIEPFIKYFVDAVSAMLGGITAVMDMFMKPILDAINYATGWWKDVLGKNIIEIKEFWLQKFPQKIKENIEKILEIPGKIVEGVGGFFKEGIDRLMGVLRTIKEVIGKVTGGAGAAVSGVKKFLGLQTGTPYVPENMLAYLHKGEAVIPASDNAAGGAGGITLNFNAPIVSGIQVSSNASIDDLAKLVGDKVVDAITSASRSRSWMG